jgi:hypothetical protein
VPSKPIVIEGEAARRWIGKMLPYEKREVVEVSAVQIPDDFIVIQDADDAPIRGKLHARKDCYLVRSRGGILYPVTEETFRRLYSPVEE